MLKKSIVKNFHSIVGEENTLLETHPLESYAVDNLVPQAVLFPGTVEQVSEILKLATKESLSVIPRGSGTKISLGNKPVGADIVVCTKNLNRIIEHGASDLVATTECGISLNAFQAELNKENQFLALDPPHVAQNATVGGIIATNDSGPGRLRYGTAREFLIGIKVVKGDGSVFKGGSKVVKNVAGYDLPKLYVGSLGTLGIIVEATFRLYPVPEYSETYTASFSSLKNCQEAVLALLNSDLVLTSLELLNPELSRPITGRNNLSIKNNGYSLLICVRNVEKAVKDQMSTVENICHSHGGEGLVISGENEKNLWDDVRDFPQKLHNLDMVVCKSSVLVTQIPSLMEEIGRLSNKNSVKIRISTRAGNGISILAIEGKSDSVKDALGKLRNFLTSIGGVLILQESPIDFKESFDVWGDIGSGLGIMRRIKTNFDPDNLLNPGRYI
jgi:glycolate oxidase FAD binding subunit